tara:strand:+ start:2163 stop:2366 length:204 start_codon:yes stop_codon:yes gene_type:complete
MKTQISWITKINEYAENAEDVIHYSELHLTEENGLQSVNEKTKCGIYIPTTASSDESYSRHCNICFG